MHAKPSSPLAQKLLFYGVSAGAVALAASARADMVQANVSGNNIYFDPGTGAFSTQFIDTPLSLTTTVEQGDKQPGTLYIAQANFGFAITPSTQYVINSPSPIDGSQTYGNGALNKTPVGGFTGYGTHNTFQPGGSGFLGFEDEISADTYFYGRADIIFNGFGAPQGTFTLVDFSAVPEPSSVALLVAGAAGAAVWRRRRQQAGKTA